MDYFQGAAHEGLHHQVLEPRLMQPARPVRKEQQVDGAAHSMVLLNLLKCRVDFECSHRVVQWQHQSQLG